MFIDKNKFKRLIKQQYKGTGVHIANLDDCWYMAGMRWEFYFEKRYVPKEVIATIYEIAGMIPDAGEQVLVDKAGVQYEINVFDEKAVLSHMTHDADLQETNFVVMCKEAAMRLFQAKNGQVIYTENAAACMINTNYCEEFEEPLESCFYHDGRIYWDSRAGYICFDTYDTIPRELLDDLKAVDLDPNRWE